MSQTLRDRQKRLCSDHWAKIHSSSECLIKRTDGKSAHVLVNNIDKCDDCNHESKS